VIQTEPVGEKNTFVIGTPMVKPFRVVLVPNPFRLAMALLPVGKQTHPAFFHRLRLVRLVQKIRPGSAFNLRIS
jgi:hypothetical protein